MAEICPLFLTESQWETATSRLKSLEETLSTTIDDHHVRARLQKEHTVLAEALALVARLKALHLQKDQLERELLENTDPDMRVLIQEEFVALAEEQERDTRELESLLYPADPENDRSVILEIRAGTGGLEASLFAGEMIRMYTMYAQKNGWSVSVVSASETDIGGCREMVLHIEGKKVFERLRHESGVHRVQRVPSTEASGRVHTSTVTVAVLPEAEEVEIAINPGDIRVDTYRASGAGGQHVNKTDSAVRITHIPTGLVVACQDDRSQHKNRAKAFKVLQSRLLALEKEKQASQVSQMRREMVASADRSEKVRTYNFPQNRVTDHQIEMTVNRLDFFLLGHMDEIIIPLVKQARAERSTNPIFASFIKAKDTSC